MTIREKCMGRDMVKRSQWEKNKYRRIALNIDRERYKNIIEHLESQENMQEYLIRLIQEDMERGAQ